MVMVMFGGAESKAALVAATGAALNSSPALCGLAGVPIGM
jgi:hypothetical protein